MKILDKYLIKLFFKNFVLLIGIFSLIIISSQLLHLPSFAYSMNIIDFSKLLFLIDISFIKYQLLFAFFISWLLVGISLRDKNEIYAVYSAGISRKQLLKSVFIMTVIFVIIAFVFSTIIVPAANRERYKFLTYKVKSYILENVSPKNFSKINDNVSVYVEKKEKNTFYNILIYNASNGYLITAKEGMFISNNLILKDGYIQLPSEKSFDIIKYERYTFSLDVSYIKEVSMEDFKTEDLLKLAVEDGKVLSILADRFYFAIPFMFLGFIGFLSGINTYRSKETLLTFAVSLSIGYMVLNYYFLKIIEKIPVLFFVYPIVLVAIFYLVYKLQEKDRK
jgi:lipopolysaccharide export system permease protein